MSIPTHLHFAEAEHVVTNQSYYSESYIALCQKFLDDNAKAGVDGITTCWAADGKNVIQLHGKIVPSMLVDIEDE